MIFSVKNIGSFHFEPKNGTFFANSDPRISLCDVTLPKLGLDFLLVELQFPSAFHRYITLASMTKCSKVINV